ncbi:hypothetical protein DFR58_104110 [Anaerobacterium chartisolvens]|uniref:N-acetyl sugar amidotransferase n=1 Tax=Anaerobacterium chartisolvens TaxID=1297424 RepID=A0A369BBQ4_9FIRM|nr:hypothetical protein [Anaerobacterium chartisolvens]RCX18841.1 hypothetical protein DFR58_104110 [Anaerobacterium chartisolvens]
MKEFTHRRCRKCLLQEDPYHNVHLNEDMVCNVCSREAAEERMGWEELREIFEGTIQRLKGRAEYDGVVMMSGGKDSAYLAYTLKRKYGLKLLGLINDIHFEYQETFDNASKICEALDIPLEKNVLPRELTKNFFHFLFTEKELRDKSHGHICNYCGRVMIRAAGEYAKARGIPMVFSGHNPEQVFGMGESYEIDEARKIRRMFTIKMISDSLVKAKTQLRLKRKPDLIAFFPDELFPEGVTGLFMYQHFPYEPLHMMEVIKRELGWRPINKFSKTYIASGCRLAKLWMHLAYMNKTSSYVDFELSNQIRSGVLSKDLVEKFYNDAVDSAGEIEELLDELGITGGIESIL